MKKNKVNKLSYLTLRSLKQKLKSKWFLVVNILLLILLPLVTNIDSVIKYFGGDFNEPTIIYVIDNAGAYTSLEAIYNETSMSLDSTKTEMKLADKPLSELKEELKNEESKNLIIEINRDSENYLSANFISYDTVDTLLYQSIVSSINTTKINLALIESNIDLSELANINESVSINRVFLNEEMDENSEFMEFVSSLVIPIIIIPFFFLIIMVVSMIGAEINEEKTSRSMEIIISSVSPKTHFLSKMISINIFILLQAIMLLVFSGIGLFLRTVLTGESLINSFGVDASGMINTFVASPSFNTILIAIPVVIILFVLSFIAYSLLAGILASMTTSMEDFQQLQTPLMVIIMVAYYIGLMAAVYPNSTFITTLSMVPFISAILAPCLLVMGQIGFVHVAISVVLLILVIFLLLRYGLRIYKIGILNYSSEKLWKKIFKAVKSRD